MKKIKLVKRKSLIDDVSVNKKKPSEKLQKKILTMQNYKCYYCDREIGTIRSMIGVEWDHFIPFSYCQNNNDDNFIACCPICNRLKSNYHFKDIFECREYIQKLLLKRGYK